MKKALLAGSLSCCAIWFIACQDSGLGSEDPPHNADAPIVFFDMSYLLERDLSDLQQRRRVWDETHLLASLQGLVNRDGPRLFLRYLRGPDDFWWEQMRAEGGWLSKRTIEHVTSLEQLLQVFRADYDGLVIWDERVPATSNLASTIAGCERLLCLRFDPTDGSLYRQLLESGGDLERKVRLLNEDDSSMFTGQGTIPETTLASTGSAKCDAYRWLIERYVKTGKVNARRLGYYLDGHWLQSYRAAGPEHHTLTNHDYLIARRGLIFDLNVWDDEACVDDPQQEPGTDAQTLRVLLCAAYDQLGGQQMIHVAGFVPWAYKYTTHASSAWQAKGTHEPVPTEWKYAEILSCFNAYMDADAIGLGAMANASFYQHYPLAKRYPQNARPTRESLIQRGILDEHGKILPRRYVAHYVGDYDSAAWLYQQVPRMWTDPARGKTPLSWAFNPNLCERFPLGMAWTRENRSANDFFVAGDSGAGYLNPGLLSPPRWHSDLPSGMNVWQRHCQQFYEQWDLSLTGFVIDGFAPGLTAEGLDAYSRFSPDGIVPQKIPPQGIHQGMPYLRMGADLPASPIAAARTLYRSVGGVRPQFAVCRSILRTPSWYVQVEEELKKLAGDQVQVVDLYTLMWLVREYETHRADYIDSRWVQAKELSAQPQVENGICAVFLEDGPFEVGKHEDVVCWQLAAKDRTSYLYFDVNDAFSQTQTQTQNRLGEIEVVVEYLDADSTQFGLEYDSTDESAPIAGAYKAASQRVRCRNTGRWRTAVFRVTDPRLAGSQNGTADFRIFYSNGPLFIRSVTFRR